MYNYSTTSHEVQPLLDNEPVQVAPTTAKAVVGRRRGAAVAPVSLTPYHISSQLVSSPPLIAPSGTGQFSVWVDGSLMNVKRPRQFVRGRKGLYLRGRVSGFSSSSRRRLMRRFAKLRSDARPLFLTLTYPGEFSVDSAIWKNDLDKFAMRFHRRFPGGAFVWRLEPQRRLAPHYHLLVYGVPFSGDTGLWFKEAWFGCVGSGDERHLAYGVHVEPLRSARGVRSYVSKYIAKKQTAVDVDVADPDYVDWSKVGRWWGVRFGENLPESELFSGSGLTDFQSVKLLRAMRGFLRSGGRRISGCLSGLTMFTEAPMQWLDAIDRLVGGSGGSGSFMAMGRGYP